MKRISFNDFNPSMGILIDVQHPADFKLNPTSGAVNIYADKLLMDSKHYLNPVNKYYIICNKGFLSRRIVAMLEYLGYDVTQVLR